MRKALVTIAVALGIGLSTAAPATADPPKLTVLECMQTANGKHGSDNDILRWGRRHGAIDWRWVPSSWFTGNHGKYRASAGVEWQLIGEGGATYWYYGWVACVRNAQGGVNDNANVVPEGW